MHGNVAMGFCERGNYMAVYGTRCPRCGKILRPINLLFPIKNKDYTSDISVAKSWKELTKNLSKAYMLTIFGYSAPKSDIAAINMMKEAWEESSNREIEEIEMIDICEESETREKWKDFVCEHHYSVHHDFFQRHWPKHHAEVVNLLLIGQ